jgi:glycosyltransferase involved in cell wall biosynthesis
MDNLPLFSIIIPARNEERWLPLCLDSIREAAREIAEKIEIIVVVNRSHDRTAEIAASAGAVVIESEAKNLAILRNCGCRVARGKFLITIDADSRMSKNMLVAINAVLLRGDVVGGAVPILPERWSVGICVTALMLLPIAVRYGISGGLFFLSREDFEVISGFNEELCSVEDIDFARRLKEHGKISGRKFKILFNTHIVTSCRKFDRFGDWYMVRHPGEFLRLLRGRDQVLANKFWYDFER